MVEYFKGIFNNSFVSSPFDNHGVIPHLISDEDSTLLTQAPSENKIFDTIKGMKSDYMDGPDGFNINVFQKSWDIVKRAMVNTVRDFF